MEDKNNHSSNIESEIYENSRQNISFNGTNIFEINETDKSSSK